MRGKTLCVYLPLDASKLDSKFKVEEAEASKYSDTPVLYRIKNERRLKYAKGLIDMVAKSLGAVKGEAPKEDYAIPYEDDKALIAKGLIKDKKAK